MNVSQNMKKKNENYKDEKKGIKKKQIAEHALLA